MSISDDFNRDTVLSIFKSWDLNQDGNIDRSELEAVIKQLSPAVFGHEGLDEFLTECDTNDDGKISFEEFIEHLFDDQEGASSALHPLVRSASVISVVQDDVDMVYLRKNLSQCPKYGTQMWEVAVAGDPCDHADATRLNESKQALAAAKAEIAKSVETQKFTGINAIRKALDSGGTVLVRGSWLVNIANSGAPLPRRQDVTSDGIWECKELIRQVTSDGPYNRIIAISYCWLTAKHPDPDRSQTKAISHAVNLRLTSCFAHKVKDVAIFLDWCCIPQRQRSEEEKIVFKKALADVNLWYASSHTMVWMLTRVPEDIRQYDERGWPNFEKNIAQLIHFDDDVLDLGLISPASCETWEDLVGQARVGRQPPAGGLKFAELLKDKHFTKWADHNFVVRKYARTFEEVFGAARILQYSHMEWDDSDVEHLVHMLAYCSRLIILNLCYNHIGDRGAMLLADALASCPSLQVLTISNNRIGDAGAIRLAEAQQCHPNLQLIQRSGNCFGPAAEEAFGVPNAAQSSAIPDRSLVVCIYFSPKDDTEQDLLRTTLSNILQTMGQDEGVKSCAFLHEEGGGMLCRMSFLYAEMAKKCCFVKSSSHAGNNRKITCTIDAWHVLYGCIDITLVEVHGQKIEVDKLRVVLAKQFDKVQFWPHVSDAHSFYMPQKFLLASRSAEETQVDDRNVYAMVHWQIRNEQTLDGFVQGCDDFAALAKKETGVVLYGFTMCGQKAVCKEAYDSAAAFFEHLKIVESPLDAARQAADLTHIEFQGPTAELEALRAVDFGCPTRYFSCMDGAFIVPSRYAI